MQSHAEERKPLEIWNFNQVNIVNYLRGPCKVDRFSEDLIHQVCGILDVNTFEARSSSGNMIRCIYPKSSIPSHNCVSNVTHSISNNREGDYSDYKIALRASVVINKGEELFISYTYPMWPTVVRRTFIKQSKYFDCNCLRCSDPTELGTHMGTLKCTRCKDGMVLSSEPLEYDSLWKCSNCEYTISNFAVQTMYKTMQDEIDQVDSMRQDSSALEAREYLLEKYKSILHPRNAFLTCLRISLVQMYGKMQGHDFPNIFYERKIELCQRVLENINIVEPGYTRLRGMILFELHTPIVSLTRNLYKTGKIDKNCLRNRLQEARKLLKEASTILMLEPENSPEGIIGRIAKNAYDQFEEC